MGETIFPHAQQFNSYEEVTEVTGNKYPVIDQIYALLEMGGEWIERRSIAIVCRKSETGK